MFKHEKTLFHPVEVEKPNPQRRISPCRIPVPTHLPRVMPSLFLLSDSKKPMKNRSIPHRRFSFPIHHNSSVYWNLIYY